MENGIKDHVFIVFALDHYNPLGVVRSLGEAGINPVLIAVKHKVDLTVKSKYVKECYKVKNVEEGFNILVKNFSSKYKYKPFVITCDDKTEGYLDEHYDELKDNFYFFNAGDKGQIAKYMDKKNILELAKKHGLKILNSIVVSRGEIPDSIGYPIITKSISPNSGKWKSDVHICFSEAELIKAYNGISSSIVLLQEYIEKKNELCLDGYSINAGEDMFISIASKYNYQIPGYYSPYMTVSNFDNPEMEIALKAMLKEIGFEGIFSIEFLIDNNDNYYFSEINFRNSTWSYASTYAGMSLPVLWAESTINKKIPEDVYKPIPNNFMAMVEPVDYMKRVNSKKIDLSQWISDFKKTECCFYYNENDLYPFREMLGNFEKLG